MKIIPVLDVLDGIAVHAKRGRRDRYAPLSSCLADAPGISALVAGLAKFDQVDALYIADLDSIIHRRGNQGLCRELARSYPELRFVIDVGLKPGDDYQSLLIEPNIDLIIASECLSDLSEYAWLRARLPATRTLLSLDRNGEQLFGPADLFEQPQLWPQRVIHMNLALVGSNEGPDWDGLRRLNASSHKLTIYAAGGVRDTFDLNRLERMGVAAVLVGSALHDGRIALE